MEAEILDERGSRAYGDQVCPGLALIRDANGPRAFETLLRYRGALLAELLRSLRALKALQSEARKAPPARAETAPGCQAPAPRNEADPSPVLIFESGRTRERTAAAPANPRPARSATPTSPPTEDAKTEVPTNEPEPRTKPALQPSGTARQPGIGRLGKPPMRHLPDLAPEQPIG
jgi:hypothetical protein